MKTSTSQSGIFSPRLLAAFALCSLGVFIGLFGLGATSPTSAERTPANSPAHSQDDPGTVGRTFSRLPAGVPLPLDARVLPNEHRDRSSDDPAVGLPGLAATPFRPSGLDAPTG